MTEGSPEPTPEPPGRSLAPVVAVVMALVLAAASFGVWWWGRPQPEPQPAAPPVNALTTEARINVLRLCEAVQHYREEHGVYIIVPPNPPEVPRGVAVPWPAQEQFQAIGFEPGAQVRYQYEVTVHEDPVGEPEVTCLARGDLDGNGLNSVFRVTLDVNGTTSPVRVERENE